MDLMPFDELNQLKLEIPAYFTEAGTIRDVDSLLDMLEDFFLLAYANGVETVNMELGGTYRPGVDTVMDTVDREIQGKTWRDRVREYAGGRGTVADIERILETEAHRDANAGAYDAARANGATVKVWNTMLDDRVRDSHEWLEGVTAPIDGVFYNWNGASTRYPGEWGIPEEDCNCRCWCSYR